MGRSAELIITVDTNVLVRSSTQDHAEQAELANAVLRAATSIVVTLPVLCEYVWVLRQAYGISRVDIAQALRALVAIDKVKVNRPAVDAGLALLEAGGDFADGVIAYEGSDQGSEVFVTFDRKAALRLQEQGIAIRLLS